MAKRRGLQAFKPDFDALATDGCIGDPNGQPAYLYLRVSSDGQAEEGRSGLPRQIEHCHEIARKNGYKIDWDLVFADDDSGFEFEARPELSRLRKEFKSNQRRAEAIVIEHLDRLSRNADWHQGFLLHEMAQFGLTDIFWKKWTSRIERAVMGAIAQDGMEHEIERMTQGTIRKAQRGRITAKTPAHGLKFVDPNGHAGTMEARKETCYAIDEEKSVVMQFIFDAIAYRGRAARELAVILDEKAKIDTRFKPPRAKTWGERTIVNMIRNPVYKGTYIANRFYTERVTVYDDAGRPKYILKERQRPESEWFTTPVPAIIDEATWELANKKLYKNKGFAKRNKRYAYLLTALIRCGTCGWRYHGQTREPKPGRRMRTRYQRYYCSKIYKTPALREQHPCGQPSIKCEILDVAVWTIIVEALLNPDVLLPAIDAKYAGEAIQEILDQIGYIEQQIADKITEEEKFRKVYLADGYTAEEFAALRKQLKHECAGLTAEAQRLRSQVMTPEELAQRKRETIALLERARQCGDLANAPFALKHKIVKLLIDEIVLNTKEGWFQIKGLIGEGFFRLWDDPGDDPVESTSGPLYRHSPRCVQSVVLMLP